MPAAGNVMNSLPIDKVLAPTDLSDSDAVPVRYAATMAERFGAALTVMYADPILYPGDPLPAEPQEEARLRAQVDQRVEGWLDGRVYELLVIPGQPVASILYAADQQKANLIVMGTHARRGIHRALLGSVAEGVLHGSACPVITVSQRHHPPAERLTGVTKIVCPINFTDTAYESLRWASRMARAFGAELIAIHVVEPDTPPAAEADLRQVRAWIEPELESVVSYRELVLHGIAATDAGISSTPAAPATP